MTLSPGVSEGTQRPFSVDTRRSAFPAEGRHLTYGCYHKHEDANDNGDDDDDCCSFPVATCTSEGANVQCPSCNAAHRLLSK